MKKIVNEKPINTTNNVSRETKMTKPNENSGVLLQGHIKIFDPQSGEVFVDKRNAHTHLNKN